MVTLEPDQIQILIDALEVHLLGEAAHLTSIEVAEQAGVPLEVAQQRWRSLGFGSVDPEAVMFTDLDVEALRMTHDLAEEGFLAGADEAALVRSIGRTFARLAEWQITLLARRALQSGDLSVSQLARVMDSTTPKVQAVQDYTWRRHLLNSAGRFLIAPDHADASSRSAVGFADIVGYTRQSRELHTHELTQLVDEFEARALSIISEHRGRIVKTIGDEVMYSADNPVDAAEIALQLTEQHDDDFPELRVGVALGEVAAHLGDIYGPPVNMAARLTSLARPGHVLIDRELADALSDHDEFAIRRLRRASVKGYRRLEPWSLRRAGKA